ncbi:MAG: adaptor protein MecA [Clostridia bacterium]|nr:adaptor protein MecA [Clostridia bacterium]
MKVEKISPNKFKLTFSDEDLKDFGVDFENIRYNSEDAQELFWNLIEHADIEEEFFRGDVQIVVEAVATKNDGLTMTITRVADNSKKIPKIKHRKGKAEKHTDISPVIFSFDEFENLVQACKYIENIFVGVSRLYKMEGEYFLVMDAIHESVAVSVGSVLHEYGEKVLNSIVAEGKLSEYGDLLIKNTAIANISANF